MIASPEIARQEDETRPESPVGYDAENSGKFGDWVQKVERHMFLPERGTDICPRTGMDAVAERFVFELERDAEKFNLRPSHVQHFIDRLVSARINFICTFEDYES